MNTAEIHDHDLDEQSDEALLIRAWRSEQLFRLGLPRILAVAYADTVDWHELADLVDRGCPTALALEIVR
ncbi:MAG TPA: hypothetical protein VE269_07660 [Gaiellaceae bacterium]|nr:hypothetical protein [Gaiellaceae bacterium]